MTRVWGWLILVALLSSQTIAPASPTGSPPPVLWERGVGQDGFDHIARAVAMSPDGASVWIAGTATPAEKRDDGRTGYFWLWRFNAHGERVAEIELKSPTGLHRPLKGYWHIPVIAALENGEVMLAAEFSERNPSLVKVGKDGSVVSIKSLIQGDEKLTINDIVPTRDGKIWAVGKKFSGTQIAKAFVAQYTADGRIVWERTLDHDQPSQIVDGVATENHELVIVGNSIENEQWVGRGQVWLSLVDRQGKVRPIYSVSGHRGRLVRTQQGYVLVYEQTRYTDEGANVWQQDILFQAFDKKLKPLWRKQLLSNVIGASVFQLAPLENGDVVVAGAKALRLWLSRIDGKGDARWIYFDENEQRVDRYSTFNYIVSNRRDFVAVYALPVYTKSRDVTYKVGILKFADR